MEHGPIFIAGLERTGTSLIYALLASHPRIAMTRRTNWWPFFVDRFGDLEDDANLDRLLDEMFRYRRHLALEPERARLRAAFVAGPRTYPRLFEVLEEQHAERLGKPRWGDKSLNTERYAQLILAAFPGARFLHMVRDPRDRFASVVKRWGKVRGGAGAATAMWLDSVELAERNTSSYPDRYRIVRYETLVRDPEGTLRAICDFIDEPYAPAMLEMAGGGTYTEAGANSSYGAIAPGTISTASLGRYRDVLSRRAVAFIQAYADEAMARHGYEPEPIELAPAERLRYLLVDHPVDRLRMALWRRREARRDREGRRPSAHTLIGRAEGAVRRDTADATSPE